jgi:hypothetical protein
MKSMGIEKVLNFPFPTPPSPIAIASAIKVRMIPLELILAVLLYLIIVFSALKKAQTLVYLGALEAEPPHKITPLGCIRSPKIPL